MGIDCKSLGSIVVYRKNGEQNEIDHDTTVRICLQAQEEGAGLDEIIKRTIYPDLKLLRLKF